MTFSNDLYRKGQHAKINKMENFAAEMTKGKDIGTVFVTEGYEDDFDMIQLVPNRAAYTNYEGYILYNEELDKPVFIKKEEN